MTETNRIVAVLKQLVPEFLKPLLRPFYRAARFGYGKLTHHPDSRDALHDYWRNPPDAGNFPTDYLHGGGRSPYLVELVGRHIGPAGRREDEQGFSHRHFPRSYDKVFTRFVSRRSNRMSAPTSRGWAADSSPGCFARRHGDDDDP